MAAHPTSRRFLLALGACLTVGIGLSACGGGAPAATGPTAAAGSTGGAAVQTASPGELTIAAGIPYVPFEFNDASGQLIGFDVDLMAEISKRLDLKPKWLNMSMGNQFTSLAAHTVDVVPGNVTGYAPDGTIAATTVANRRKVVAFGVPYYDSALSVLINGEKSPDIKTLADLGSGDSCGVAATSISQYWGEENLAPQKVTLQNFDGSSAMYDTLLAGRVTCVVYDTPPSHDQVAKHPALKVLADIPTGEQGALTYAKDRPELMKAIDGKLQELLADGTYTTLYKKYFPGQPLPSFAK